MTVETYKVLHICGILLLFSGLTGLWGLYSSGHAPAKGARVALSSLHGFGLILILITGFGMAGKLGYMANFPVWLMLKIVIWLILGGTLVLAKRKAHWGAGLLVFWVAIGTAAAYLALFKPF